MPRPTLTRAVLATLVAALAGAAAPTRADEVGGEAVVVPGGSETGADARDATSQPTDDADDDGWQFEIAPYVWFIFISGTTSFDDDGDITTEDIDIGFDDIWKQLHFAVFLDADIRKGNFGFFGDLNYSYLWHRQEERLLTFSSKIRLVIFDFSFYYEAADLALGSGPAAPRLRLQPFVGGRYVYEGVDVGVRPIDADLQFASNTAAPVLGLRGFLDIDDNWNLSFIGDGGGFGVDGTDVTWQAELLGGYRFHFSRFDFNLMLGYKGLGFSHSDPELESKIVLHGPVLKLGFEL